MRSLDQLSSSSSSCSPVLSDDSFEINHNYFGNRQPEIHNHRRSNLSGSASGYSTSHLLMPVQPLSNPSSYHSTSSSHFARLPFGELPISSDSHFQDQPSSRYSSNDYFAQHRHLQSIGQLPSSPDESEVDLEIIHTVHSSRPEFDSLSSPSDRRFGSSSSSSSSLNPHHHHHHQHPHQSVANSSSSSTNSGDFQRGSTRGKIKICGVCGDRAKSFHFGAISCDSCKAFFRRSVQNEAYKNFHCPYNNRCDITILSRKCCQHCR